MGLSLEYFDGQTPIDEEEKEGLLIPTISTRGELDEFEQQNIEKAIQWSMGLTLKAEKAFSEEFILMVHKRMYSDVWSWSGTLRKTEKNIGEKYWNIPVKLRYLLDDVRLWDVKNIYPPDEIAIRFKHRLVSIHCFPNGNGRHSRLMADIIIEKVYKLPVFTWGSESLGSDGTARATYLKALRSADKHDYLPLLAFARS